MTEQRMDGAAATKRALLIGINRYPRLAARYQLNGCVNDAEALAATLQTTFGFPAANLTVLRDEAATRDGILAALDRLVRETGRGDVVVLGYSGHGSQMTDREGDEPDGLDETLVPHDSGRGRDATGADLNRDITDDELYLRLLALTERTSALTLIFDCCHSGTITRDAFGTAARWVEPDRRPAAELPPSPIPAARDLGGAPGPSGWLPLGARYVLIAGCRDEESAYEHPAGGDGPTHGALSFFLGRELAAAAPGTTYRDVFERASARVTAGYPRQHPQLEGARDREIFGVRDIAPLHAVPVRGRDGGRATLGAGAAHGLTAGSTWAVYPRGTKGDGAPSPRLGLLRIGAVRAVSADAAIVEEAAPGAVAPGCRAVEEAHAYGDMALAVDLQPAPAGQEAALAGLADLIGRSRLLRAAAPSDADGAAARVYLIPARAAAGAGDPAPQLGALPEATWAVVGRDGQLLLPPRPAGAADAAAIVRDGLERQARYRNALTLRNASPDSPLRDKIAFTLLRRLPDGSWAPVEPEDAGGQVAFAEGDRLGAEITNRHTAPVYVTVLDFGLTGAIGQVHPIAGASEGLAPGGTTRIGVRDGDEIALYLPENFPFVPAPGGAEPDGGLEVLKLFATTHEADFSGLVQVGVRSADPGGPAAGLDSPLGRLLGLALAGGSGVTRDLVRARPPAGEEWTTVERPFLLRRRGL